MGQKDMACSLVAALFGVCCLGGSIYCFSQMSSNTREAKVTTYDKVVNYWAAVGRKQFSNVNCVVSNITTRQKFSLKERSIDESLRDSSSSDLPKYTPLFYGYTGNIAPGREWNAAGKIEKDVTITCSGGAAPQVSSLLVPKVLMYYTEIDALSNQKQCMYKRKGSFVHGRCEVYHKVKQICIKVSPVQGKWVLNTTWGGFGCHRSNKWNPVTHQWTSGAIRSFGHGTPPKGPVALDDMQVLVRSSLDPILEAEELTNDSLDFGASKKDQVIIGTILLILSVTLCFPLGYRYHESRQRQQASRARAFAGMQALEEEEFGNPLQDDTGIPMDGFPKHSNELKSTFGTSRSIGAGRLASL